MSGFKHLQYGSKLKLETIRSAVEERDGEYTKELLTRLEQISRPEDKIGGNVLLILAGMARYARWLPDLLHVALTAKGERTEMDLQSNMGGMRERLWRKFRFNTPIEEFAAWADKLAQREDCPFKIEETWEGDRVARLTLDMLCNIRQHTLPPTRADSAVATDQASNKKPAAKAAKPPIRRSRATVPPAVGDMSADRQAAVAKQVPDKPRTTNRPPKRSRKKTDPMPSVLPLVRSDEKKSPAPDLAPPPSKGPNSYGPASKPISTDEVDDEW